MNEIKKSIKNKIEDEEFAPPLAPGRENTSMMVLSTKILSKPQKELLLNAGIGLVEYDAITIELLDVPISKNTKNAIFTSKNAVRSVFNKTSEPFAVDFMQRVFCVGENTKKLLEQNGCNVIETAPNASELAKIIVNKYKEESFTFFCGNIRRDQLPNILKQNNVVLQEEIVYKTYQNNKKFDRRFDGLLFFSPSAIKSYVLENKLQDSVVFCIGNTTATEAKNHTNSIVIANKPTIENVIIQAIKYSKNQTGQ